MSFESHIRIAQRALRGGLIDVATVAEVVTALADHHVAPSVNRVWVETGRLTEDELSSIIMEPNLPTKLAADFDIVAPGSTVVLEGGTEDPTKAVVPIHSLDSIQATVPSSSNRHMAQSTLPPVSVSERYAMRGVLGEGGLGEVTRRFDSVLLRTVAVKATRRELVDDDLTNTVLEREALIVAGLEHPNIIPIYDAGTDPSHGPYYVMREINEAPLDVILKKLRDGDEKTTREFSLKRMLRFFVQICRAVDYANQSGVIHCDLKPANILLGEFGEVLVVDWGLAHSQEQGDGPRGGTPGYMAPEQMRIDTEFSATTDVFALGSILYRMMTLKNAFAVGDRRTFASDDPQPALSLEYSRPVPPRERAPERDISQDLEDICLKALEFEQKNRHESAGELADAIEEFLEGTKERERRRAEAKRLTAGGEELAERYHEFDEARPEEIARLAELRADLKPWARIEEKQELWDAEDMLAVTDSLKIRTLHAAVSSFEQALEAVPHHEEARRSLARLYWAEYERARRRHDDLDRIHFERLVEQYDDGALLNAEDRNGRLVVTCDEPGASLTLFSFREDQRRLVRDTATSLDSGKGESTPLAPGSYVVEATCAERSACFAINVRASAETKLDVTAELVLTLAEGEALIHGGLALLGGTESADAGEPREALVETFAIQKRPVTFAEYTQFLDALAVRDPGSIDLHVPRTDLGDPLVVPGEGWRPSEALLRITNHYGELPAFGVSARSADTFAAWWSLKTGRNYRLPTDDEWEKAARGVDGRIYTWGNQFDETFCRMRTSRPGASTPEPSGTFEADVSPYGVMDLSGGLADWTLPAAGAAGGTLSEEGTEQRVVYSRGGAWCDAAFDCRLPARQTYVANACSQRVGFRLARSFA